MDRKKLAEAVEEAKRFIAKAEALPAPKPYTIFNGETFCDDNFPKEQGAIRRSSMDLTRALANFRRR